MPQPPFLADGEFFFQDQAGEVQVAHLRAAGSLASPTFAKARGVTLRRDLIHVAARTARHGRGHLDLHLPGGWHRQTESILTVSDAQADLKNAEAALLASWGRIDGAIDTSSNCAANSYGQVKKFFQANPCKWLFQGLFQPVSATSETSTLAVIIAISWVYMPNVPSAYKYFRLADTSGTGNVTELSRDIGLYKGVKYSGKYYESGIRGIVVWNAEAQPTNSVSVSVVNTALTNARQ